MGSVSKTKLQVVLVPQNDKCDGIKTDVMAATATATQVVPETAVTVASEDVVAPLIPCVPVASLTDTASLDHASAIAELASFAFQKNEEGTENTNRMTNHEDLETELASLRAKYNRLLVIAHALAKEHGVEEESAARQARNDVPN